MNQEPSDGAIPATSPLSGGTPESGEPSHTLWKQIAGLCIAAIIALVFFGLAGILITATGAVVFADAWFAGVFKKRTGSGFLNMSPMAWGIATMGLFVIAYPLYAFNRNRLKTRPGKPALFVVVNVLGGLLCLLTVVQLAMRVA